MHLLMRVPELLGHSASKEFNGSLIFFSTVCQLKNQIENIIVISARTYQNTYTLPLFLSNSDAFF